jgi:hypothetical protein
LKFIFAIPEDSAQIDFIKANFRRDKEFIPAKIKFTKGNEPAGWLRNYLEVAAVRELMLQHPLVKASNHALFLDSDVMPPRDTIQTLVGDQKDIVGGIVRIPDFYGNTVLAFGSFTPLFRFAKAIPKEEVAQVDSVNTACMLLSHDVINDGRLSFSPIAQSDGIERQMMSEDQAFCFTAGKVGYSVWVDTRIRCSHLRMALIGKKFREVRLEV